MNEEENFEQPIRPQKHWFCNELIHELCKEIPTAKTSDRILLTAHKMYAYLEPQFSKKLIYRDAIAFIKAVLKAKKGVEIRIGGMAQNKESDQIVAINQEQSDTKFYLETNQFFIQIYIWNATPENGIFISKTYAQYECAHFLYFLRLIAALLQPIQLHLSLDSWDIPTIAGQAHFMSTQSDWIDWIALWDFQFDSEPVYEALGKWNKLQINGPLKPVNVQKLIHWLTSKNDNNNGQPKKYLFFKQDWLDDWVVRLIDELKKEFVRATSKCRFVVRMEFYGQQLDEFTLRNELTGEKLQLRHTNIVDKWYIHALNRTPDNGLDDGNENDCAEFETFTEINLR